MVPVMTADGISRARGTDHGNIKITTRVRFRPAHAAMQRYVDGNLLSGFFSVMLV